MSLPPIDFHDWTCNNNIGNDTHKCLQYNHKQSSYCVKCGKHRFEAKDDTKKREISSSFSSSPSPLLMWRCLLCAGNNYVHHRLCQYCKASRPHPSSPYHTWVPRKNTSEIMCSRCDYIYRKQQSCPRCGF
jgi:hypothetical protein